MKKLVDGTFIVDEFRTFRTGNPATDEYIYEQLAKELDIGRVSEN
jgi:hypothetical protein